ncbi:MAG: tRNA (adenosine(37)-N6)-threonylcarbamoyltransferase complex dimerization subunit type 1 TsaB [Rhodospirillales bacterium]|nr:tRNA (adenosine(37)-N6)-threonylcarbamoyltransferase complex dimerization subunit type 1 TsaB [Rhodospirillales bacterium]MDP6642628.1 tRNA (adenosine(37)-N6)-threonylcarbamoyltransferase complex dimerization subunit type 1 TsaB [Rhodospirillales bacterium]MDP6840556.1 tRNA (adenosine(37)-N6)-threonylcarbamoyltransferase complex dimerization subunit type 1 TsaB [Rhodospirillales bacterium]
MNILAFDCATSTCSAAVWRGGGIAAHRFEQMARGQAEALLPMIEAVMAEAASDYPDLDLIAVTIGPGAFTGLRIGLATARAMALAAAKPMFGVTSFEAVLAGLADEIGGDANVLVALETKRADIYVQLFDGAGRPLSDPAASDEDDLAALAGTSATVLVAGDAASRAHQCLIAGGIDAVLSSSAPCPDARFIARLAAAEWRPGGHQAPLEPLYLRPPDAVLPALRNRGARR